MNDTTEPSDAQGSGCLRVGLRCGGLLLLALIAVVVLGRPLSNRLLGPGPSRMAAILQKIAADQETFRAGDQEHDGVQDYGTLDELIAADLLIPAYGNGETMGYAFQVLVSPSAPTERWMAVANPVSWVAPAPAMVINQEGVLYTVPGEVNLNPECAIPADATPYTH